MYYYLNCETHEIIATETKMPPAHWDSSIGWVGWIEATKEAYETRLNTPAVESEDIHMLLMKEAIEWNIDNHIAMSGGLTMRAVDVGYCPEG